MITYLIIAITVGISIACFNNRNLFEKLAFSPYRCVKYNEWYRLITHGFVHGDYMHLFVNMFTFWSFGAYMEQWFEYKGFGTGYYLLLYFGGMIIASVYDIIKYRNNSNYLSIGASGAVSSILFAAIFLNPWDKILLFAVIPVPGIIFALCYLAYSQYMAKQSGDNINHYAHIFGAIYGFIFPAVIDPSLITEFLSHFSRS